MSGLPDYNFAAFHEAAEIVRSMGHTVVCPAESFGGTKTLDMEDYARYDIHALLQMDGVVLLSGWGRSPGACTEVAIAHWLKLNFFVLERPSAIPASWVLVPYFPQNPVATHVEALGGPFLGPVVRAG